MLQLTPEQAEALERVEHGLLIERAQAHFAVQWPAMADRLGERLPAFVAFTMAAAERHGLSIALAALRYANLCFVWGSGFEDKPGFDWARALLANPRAHAWQKIHQLVHRSGERLAGGGAGLPAPALLAQADQRLTQVFAGLGLLGRLLLREGVALPLQPCDLELAALRITGGGPDFFYQLSAAGADRVPVTAPPPALRIDTAQPVWPERIQVLAPAPQDGRTTARLQLRTQVHAVCDAAWHPQAQFCGPHGAWEWRGGDSRAVSWPLASDRAGSAIAEQSSPSITRLTLATCGLRETGLPLGTGALQIWTYPSAQWLLQLQRPAPAEQHWPAQTGSGPGAAAVTRVQFERDGLPQDTALWQQGLQALDTQWQAALERLGDAWERSAGLDRARMTVRAGLLTGQAALAWGWQAGAALTDPVQLQLQAQLDLQALSLDLQLRGELRLAGAHALLQLRVQGEAPLASRIAHKQPPPLAPQALAPAVCRWRLPYALTLDSRATPEAAVMNLRGPCSGALVGEAGLRPRLSGGSGCEWYFLLRSEPVSVDLVLHDPWLGLTQRSLELLPALTLVDWSAG